MSATNGTNGTNGVHADPVSWKHYNEGTFLFTVCDFFFFFFFSLGPSPPPAPPPQS